MSLDQRWLTWITSGDDSEQSYGHRATHQPEIQRELDDSLIHCQDQLDSRADREVFQAHQQVLDRAVELHQQRDEAVREAPRFRTESDALVQIEHPGVVPIHDRGDDFMVLPRLRHRRLADEVPADGATGEHLISLIEKVSQLFYTVSYSHRCGLSHGDIQPRHIAIGEHGEVLLQSWGLAAPVDQAVSPAGTPAWIAPEASHGLFVGRTSDVFQLACLINYCASGQSPWGNGERDALACLEIVAHVAATREKSEKAEKAEQRAAKTEKEENEKIQSVNNTNHAIDSSEIFLTVHSQFADTSLGQCLAQAFALDPQLRPTVSELQQHTQEWLSFAGQKLEAAEALQQATEQFYALRQAESDRPLRIIEQQLRAALVLDADVGTQLLHQVIHRRCALAIKRGDLILAQTMMRDELLADHHELKNQFRRAQDKLASERRLASLYRRLVVAAIVIALLIPVVLTAVRWTSDQQQITKTEQEALRLISQVEQFDHWGDAQGALSRAAGLAPQLTEVQEAYLYWSKKASARP